MLSVSDILPVCYEASCQVKMQAHLQMVLMMETENLEVSSSCI